MDEGQDRDERLVAAGAKPPAATSRRARPAWRRALLLAGARARAAVVVALSIPAPTWAQDHRGGSFAEAARRLAAETPPDTRRGSPLRRLYDRGEAGPLWSAGGHPTRQALQVIALLEDASSRGLDPRDYAAGGLAASAAELEGRASVDSTGLARFDVALSRSLLRFLADLHEGRANPRVLRFHLPDAHRGLDLAAIAADVSRAADPGAVIGATEPPYAGYSALKGALQRYRTLAADSSLRPPLPARVPLRAGDPYADAAALRRLLLALGDLPGVAARDTMPTDGYSIDLADAVTVFQRRHGLDADGVIGPATMAALRVPLAHRVRQIELTLERWRWLPDTAPDRYAVVNIPGFRLYLFEHDPTAARPLLRMNVIVGQAAGRRGTPVFSGTMREVVFRPYWDVPPSIARNELLPAIRRRPGYFERERLEIVRGGDVGAVIYPLTSANLARVASGTLRLRQRPGPDNSLGLVKFVFPNDYNVYLHGTPAQELFAQVRRDFSHGCIRVEDPLTLAEHALAGQDGWDRDAIERAMQGDRTLRVGIARPVAVYVLYASVVVRDGAEVHFYPDIYGHDATLARQLAATSAHAAAR